VNDVEKQLQAVQDAFTASDKGFEAREAAWTALAPLVPQVDPADAGASLTLVRFVKEDLVVAGPWPTAAKGVLVALLKFKRWIDVVDAARDVARAVKVHADALEKAMNGEKS
jgi:hypothetical protein